MKLVYVITRADAVGGASIHVRDLAREMIARGHEVTVLLGEASSSGSEGAVTEQLRAAGIPLRTMRHLKRALHPMRDLLALRELTAALRQLQPDLVSTHTSKAGLLGRLAAKRLGIPSIYTPHGWTIDNRISPLLGPLFGMVERVAARWCAAIVCVCEAERQLALDHRIAPEERLVVIHNGMPDIEAAGQTAPGNVPPRIACVARFEAPKDHRTLFEALRRLRDREWMLDLVGEGPLVEPLRSVARVLGIAERIRWNGYLENPAAVLAQCQLFVLSSRSEAFPRSVLEAMRAGLPVIASDVGGVREAVQHEASGLLVPPGDAAGLADALDRLLADPPLRQRMGAAGRQSYQEQFRFERMVDKTTALYALVRGGGGKKTPMGNVTSGWNPPETLFSELGATRDREIQDRSEERDRGGLLEGAAPYIKRGFDILSATALILMALPFAAVIAIAIVRETRGPVLFRQTRIGTGNRRFSIWKFRSMAVNSEELLDSHLAAHPDLEAEWKATHKLKDDPRVTGVGRFLRRRSLDELPQLWNVLKGEMSLIGPRPIVEEEVPKYGAAFELYQRVKPGLTGLWQVSGRSDTSYRRRVQLDSYYIRNWSLWLDIQVIWKTVGVVLRAHGAY